MFGKTLTMTFYASLGKMCSNVQSDSWGQVEICFISAAASHFLALDKRTEWVNPSTFYLWTDFALCGSLSEQWCHRLNLKG
jgi:hypothetical protein